MWTSRNTALMASRLAKRCSMVATAGTDESTSNAADRPNFGDVLGNAVNAVNKVQTEAKDLAVSFQTGEGDADLVDVMLAIQTASVSFKTMSEVRNKLVDAYKEIMSMPV